LLAALAAFGATSNVSAAGVCGDGLWADAMIGSYHVHPKKHFDQFNPGIGVECWVAPQWALTGGYFRNSLPRSRFMGGVWAPEFAHWVTSGLPQWALDIGIRLRQMGHRPRSQAGSGPRAGHHGGVRACRREHYPDSSDSLQRSALYARVSATNPILVTMTSLRILKPLLPALHENTE